MQSRVPNLQKLGNKQMLAGSRYLINVSRRGKNGRKQGKESERAGWRRQILSRITLANSLSPFCPIL